MIQSLGLLLGVIVFPLDLRLRVCYVNLGIVCLGFVAIMFIVIVICI